MYQTYVYDSISQPEYLKTLKDKKGPAKKGDIQAQVEYATACFYGIKNNGKDVFKPDIKLASKYAQHLSEIENADGLVLHGIMLLTGKGVNKNVAGAFNSFMKAAKKNSDNKDAKYLIAHVFFKEDLTELPLSTAINYLKQSGENDQHKTKQAMGELGILYFEGKHIDQDYELALKFLINSAGSYPPANEHLKKCSKLLTEKKFCLEYFSKPKLIYRAAMLIKMNNKNQVNGVVDQLLRWADEKDYPPAIYDYSIHHLNQNKSYFESRLMKAAEKMNVSAINYCGANCSPKIEQLIKFAKQSNYFKSNELNSLVAQAYKQECSPSSFNLGIYFRYLNHIKSFSEEDQELIEQLKLKAWKNGSNDEKFAYAICLENGFNGLIKDVETAVCIYKELSEKEFAPAARNFAHFQEFGEFTYQDLPSAIKTLEQFDDIEAKASIEMMNLMLSDNPIFPFPYNHKYHKVKNGYSKDPSKTYAKISYMLIRNKEMIPNFKLAEKILDKAKKKTPLKIAITASLCGDARAGKPNVSKAEKLFNEAMKQSSSPEIKELYAWFLISEERDEEVDSLDIDITSEISTRLRKSMIKNNKEFSTKKLTTKDQLADGKDLYYIGYKKYNDIRYLERAAETSYPIAQSEYAHFILKNEKKKEYKKALLYLQSSSENGIITSFILLGYMYHMGLEVKSNYHEALKNYTIAIENYEYQGYAGFALAYCTGRGFDKDFCMTNRYITIAKNENTIFEKPFLIDYEMFITKEYKNKFEDIKVCSNLNMNKASNAFLEATYYEFSKFEYQKAFNLYEKAYKSEPENKKYKRNYSYYLMKSIGNSGMLNEAANYYKELGNEDDMINLKIVNHYIDKKIIPYYMSDDANIIIDRIVNGEEESKDYYNLGNLILNNKKVHQQYSIAYNFLKEGAEKYNDPNCYYLMAQMSEKGFGNAFTDDEIILLYTRSALINSENEMFTYDNAKGCFKLGTILANGKRIYKDLHQACFYIASAINLKLEDENLQKEYYNVLDTLVTNKNVIDPWDEHLCNFYSSVKINENEFSELKITDLSNPYQNWTTYDQSLENDDDPNSLFNLGFQYMKGIGVAKDYNKALQFLAKAVIQNHPYAKVYFAILSKMCKISHNSEVFKFNMLGSKVQGLSLPYIEEAKVELGLYENIPKGSIDKAKELLQIAIDAGDPYALYIRGRYLEDAQALKDAAEKGCSKAYYYIAKMMIEEHKYDEAYPLIEKSALQGHPKAVFIYGYLNLLRGDKEKAEEFLYKGVNMAGNSIIDVKYGLEKLKGNVIEKNEEEAFKWFEIAHNMNNLDGTLNLAICLRDGIGCQQDLKKASQLFKIGCKLKIPEFYSHASKCYKDLKGIKNWFKEKKYGKKAKNVKINPPIYPNRIIKPICQIDEKSIYNPNNSFKLAQNNKMIDNDKFKYHLQIATKLGLFAAVKETIYQLISGFYLDKDEETAYSLTNQLIAVGWATGYKILGDIYNAKEIFIHKDKTYESYKKAAEMGSKSGKFKYGICIANGIGCKKDIEKGCSIIDSSNCKYAYNYLKKYTKYKPKISKQNNNCLSTLEKVVQVKLDFKYNKPVYKENNKSDEIPYSLNDLRILIEKNIKYGIIMYNKYCWDYKNESKINQDSLKPLEMISIMGSVFGNYQYGYTLYMNKKIKDSIKYLKFAADNENINDISLYASHFVGHALYDDSVGEHSMAKNYLSKSAYKLKDPDDYYALAFLTTDNEEAINLLDLAAKGNSTQYQFKVAEVFRTGIKGGLKPNPSKASYYYEESKYYKHISSEDLYRVAFYFLNGDGVKKNYSEAFVTFQLSADRGKIEAAANACIVYENYLIEANKKLRFKHLFPEEYYVMAANAQKEWSPHFCWNLAVYYYEQSERESIYYLEKAAHYFSLCNSPEGSENARKINEAIKDYYNSRSNEPKPSSNSNNSGAAFVFVLATAALLI